MRRRVEDDFPEALVLPPREVYRVEAITKSDDPRAPGWAYFLELWTETGPRACTSRARSKSRRALHGGRSTTSCRNR